MGYWGQPVDPGRRRQRKEDFKKKLKLPSMVSGDMEDALIEDDAEAILQGIRGVVETHMPNSSLGRFAQGWALRISSMLSGRMEKVEFEGPYPSRLLDLAAPAPGCHDATAFPELDAQPIPQGADSDHLC